MFVSTGGAGYYDEEDDEISPDLWQEACWIVIRLEKNNGEPLSMCTCIIFFSLSVHILMRKVS